MHENKNFDFSAILETIEPFLAVRGNSWPCVLVFILYVPVYLFLIVHVIFLEDKDNPREKMEIVIDKDIFIASVSIP